MPRSIWPTPPSRPGLPFGSRGADLDIAEGTTPIDVMKQLGMPLEASYLIVLNGTSVAQGERSHRTLEENASLAIMPALESEY